MGKRVVTMIASVATLAAMTVGIALASTGRARSSVEAIHVVLPSSPNVQFFDFNGDGLGLGDRLAAVGPILDGSQTKRVGTSYMDCLIVSRMLEGGTFDCTYVLKLGDGSITTHGIDPQGPSDVLFAVTGGTGIYRGADGQARYIDTDVTDIFIDLDD